MTAAPIGWSLGGRAAIVAGGGGGIGAAVAERLLSADCRVSVLDRPGRPGPDRAASIACDVSKPEDVASGVAGAIAGLGTLDVLVHCAGVTRDAYLARMTDEEWEDVIASNLNSAFYLLRACVPHLRERGGGSVVFVSSINGERGKAGQANYAASKAGMNALARSAARELGRFGIRVNVVAPGWIETPMTAALPDEIRRRAQEEVVLGRLGQPDDVAAAVLFLASEMSRHITGQVLRVDGGQLIG